MALKGVGKSRKDEIAFGLAGHGVFLITPPMNVSATEEGATSFVALLLFDSFAWW